MKTTDMYANIIISTTAKEVDRIFDYKIPEGMNITVGMRVIVPFGRGGKRYEGYVIGISDTSEVPEASVKNVISALGTEVFFSAEMLELAKWMQKKYFASLAMCLKCILPSGIAMRGGLTATVRYVGLNKKKEDFERDFQLLAEKETPRGAVLKLLREKGDMPVQEIKSVLNISESPIQTLLKSGMLVLENVIARRTPFLRNNYDKTGHLEFTTEQSAAFGFICEKMKNGDTKPTLIQGVTGSGKTEIYLRLIDEVLSRGGQAIVLVPEISLTPQAVEIFIGRFGNLVSVTHSRLSAGERYDQWERARMNEISVMIGPRSAVFTPFERLELIIIDEEHEGSYKSEVSPKYSAKEIALTRGVLSRVHVVLGSATPSVESYYEALGGEMDLLRLNERVNKTMPEVTVVDMREELVAGNRSIFSTALAEAIGYNLKHNEQTILFLNRRGHSTFVSCRKCGYVMACDSCSVNYTYHRYNNTLMCHYCGKSVKNPENCPVCGSKYIKYFGIGTQRIEEEMNNAFPNARVLRMDLDTTAGKFGHEKILTRFKNREADVLIGTQMIAKGLDFPSVSLVGIISADVSLNMGDFRCGETTYQLLAQVSGRAGRAALAGRVFIQTYNPRHYSIVYAGTGGYQEFYNHEIALRRQMMYPPFTKLFSVLFTGTEEKKIITLLFKLADIMRYYNRKELFETIGPAPAVVSKIKQNYRWKLLIKSTDEEKLVSFVLYCIKKLQDYEDTSGIQMNLTLNPLYTA